MRCQLHLDVEAAAICVSCGRALCRECQKTTRDERMICGLPQCEEFAKRQKAVQFAIRQYCASKAETQLQMANLFRYLKLVLIVLGLCAIASIPLSVGISARGIGADDIVSLVMGIISLLAAWVLHRAPKEMIAHARNWEDISREFDEPPHSQPNSPNEDQIR